MTIKMVLISVPALCLLLVVPGSAQDTKHIVSNCRPAKILPNPLPFKPSAPLSVKVAFTACQSFPDFGVIGTFNPDDPSKPKILDYNQWLALRVYTSDSPTPDLLWETVYLVNTNVDFRTVPPKGTHVEREFESFVVPVKSNQFLYMVLYLAAEFPPKSGMGPVIPHGLEIGMAKFRLICKRKNQCTYSRTV